MQDCRTGCQKGRYELGIRDGLSCKPAIYLRKSHLRDQPNLQPPIRTTDEALAYKKNLQEIDPSVEYLMTLYLSPSLTPEEVKKAKRAGIVGQFLINFAGLAADGDGYNRSQVISTGRDHQLRLWD
jgi:dihydroorotase